jgi:glucokinase
MRASVGVDLGGTNLRAALVLENGEILAVKSGRTPVQAGPIATVDLIAALVGELCVEAKNLTIVGVGVGSPGPLNRKERKIFQTPNLPGFENFPIGAELEARVKKPVCLEHDAKCAALGELFFGVAREAKHAVFLTFGTGIGGAVLAEGELLHGKSDGAGELGHMTLYPGGRTCHCGNTGCFEEYVSATALERRGAEAAGRKVSNPEIIQAYEKGEVWANLLLKSFAKDVAIGVASLANIFEPELVVLSGGLFTSGGGPLCSLVTAGLEGRCFASTRLGLRVVSSSLQGTAGVLGAATLPLGKHSG